MILTTDCETVDRTGFYTASAKESLTEIDRIYQSYHTTLVCKVPMGIILMGNLVKFTCGKNPLILFFSCELNFFFSCKKRNQSVKKIKIKKKSKFFRISREPPKIGVSNSSSNI